MNPDHLRELFAQFRPVSVRRMFSGAGVFAEGVIIALVIRDVIYLKADATTYQSFLQEGSAPFSYMAKGQKRVIGSFWRMPERLYDDPDELAVWAEQALAVAQRAAAGKVKSSGKKKQVGPRARAT
ncbi:MAG: TfoX/Sxy family protein [Xanthobacteraceae bacterium]